MLVKINTESEELFDCTLVKVSQRVALIDTEDAPRITPYTWYMRRTRYNCYAYRIVKPNDEKFLVWMHRQITHCPNDQVVHHKNRHGLDNRKNNLQLMSAQEHADFHRFR